MTKLRITAICAFIVASLGLAGAVLAEHPGGPDEHPDDPTPTSGKANNGWGNGDQDAPGNSEFKNGAENMGGNADNTGSSPGNSGH